MDLGLGGRKALITGATRGIGRAIAETLAAEGCNIAFCARDAGAVKTTEDALRSRYGVAVEGRAVDVTDHNRLAGFVQAMAALFNGLDLFVANVSGGAGAGVAQWRKNFEADVLGTVTGCEAALPWLSRSDAGSIVVISSIAAVETFGGAGGYNAMKAALITYAKQLAQEVGPRGVRVNCVSPGPVHADDGSWGQVQREAPELYADTVRRVPLANPLPRLATPEDVARAVAFLGSPAASYITGTNLIVDGGFTQRVQF